MLSTLLIWQVAVLVAMPVIALLAVALSSQSGSFPDDPDRLAGDW